MKLVMQYIPGRSNLHTKFIGLLIFALTLTLVAIRYTRQVGAQAGVVTSVSAASFAGGVPLAPDSIVAAFGVNLATGTVSATPGQPLPTTLGGTTVAVNGQLAPLFFVSASQINYLIPAGTAAGQATVLVTPGAGPTSQGTIQIAPVAPGVFGANADGSGAPAAVLVRVPASGPQTIEPATQIEAGTGRVIPRPIDLGPDGEQVFVVLFASGLRAALTANVHMLIGGVDAPASFVGATPGLSGLDQLNGLIPRSLIGRGRVTVAVAAQGAVTSNLVELEIAPRPGGANPQVNNYDPNNVFAGNDMTISGAGFSQVTTENTVRIGGTEATVQTAASNTLTVKVPFGVIGGPLTVQTQTGQGAATAPVAVKTSVSGFLEDTSRTPITGARVTLRSTALEDFSSPEGSFLLGEVVTPGLSLVDIDPSTAEGGLPYPNITIPKDVLTNRDNMIDRPVPLEPISGPSLTVGDAANGFGADSLIFQRAQVAAPDATAATNGVISTNGVTLEIPPAAGALFPGGAKSGVITLTALQGSRTPVNLPPGVFSSDIVQITPFGVKLNPGGKLTFPNRDGVPAGSLARLFKFDQTPGSPTLGKFIDAGPAVVSDDGSSIESLDGAVTDTTYYFVAIQRQTTTVIGRVVEADAKTPIRRALVNVRGQEAFTDGNGGFILRQVPANPGDVLTVIASVQRANKRVDRSQSEARPAILGGVTNVGDIILPKPPTQTNLPPEINGLPTNIVVTENTTAAFKVQIIDPNGERGIKVSLDAPQFVQVQSTESPTIFSLVIAAPVRSAGVYKAFVVAQDGNNGSTVKSFSIRVNRAPIAIAQQIDVAIGKPRVITLLGSDPDQDPINFLLVTPPKGGTLSGGAPDVTYTPNPGFAGTDAFTIKANDGYADSAPAQIVLTVRGSENITPTLTAPTTIRVRGGTTLNFQVRGIDQNQTQILRMTSTKLPTGASLKISGTNPIVGDFAMRTPAGVVTSYKIAFTVTDNGIPNLSATQTVVIQVGPFVD